MSLSAAELSRVLRSLDALGLVDSFLQKLSLAEPRSALLELRRPGRSFRLLLCAESGRTRLHLVSARTAAPAVPFPFQGQLRAELLGRRLEALERLGEDRVLSFRFGAPGAPARQLVAELTGRHGNLFLLDENGLILGSALPNLSKQRANGAGARYQPPDRTKLGPAADGEERFAGVEGEALSHEFEALYSETDGAERRQAALREQARPLRAARQRTLRTLERVRGDLERAGAAERERQMGELLRANLHQLARGAQRVTLTDYREDGAHLVEVELDPALSPKAQVERHFHRYRRLSHAKVRAAARLAELNEELAKLEGALTKLEAEGPASSIEGSAERRAPAQPPRALSRGAARRLPYREYLSSSGERILVGKSARENDALTFKIAKGNDLWLHARGVEGAHVLIPLERGTEPKGETLREAALLAAASSRGASQGLVEVAVTRARYVRRARSGAPGSVTYSQERTLAVREDPERLRALKARMK